MVMLSSSQIIYEYICEAKAEVNIDKRLEILREINKLLPASMRLKIPSFVTNHYVDTKLSWIEEQIMGRSTQRNVAAEHSSGQDQGPIRQLYCECGNVIEYTDIQLNCNFPEYRIITCNSCKKSHRIVVDGKLASLAGAT